MCTSVQSNSVRTILLEFFLSYTWCARARLQGNSFGSVETLLDDTLKKIGIVLDHGGARHMCYLIIFIVFTFVALYFIMKMRKAVS